MSQHSYLSQLRELGTVSCDTLWYEEIVEYGPFEDSTFDQAILYKTLSEIRKTAIMTESIVLAYKVQERVDTPLTFEELVLETVMIRLASTMMAYVRGRVHLPINPKYAYNSDEIVERAMQTINLFYHFGDNFDVNRICIDIPATWEGLEACRLLEVHGIRTSATMAFNLPQAILAGLNGCTYVSPYIDGTKLHDKTRSPDDDTTYVLCHDIKKYYQERNIKTKVMPGFLTAADTVGKYSGIDNLVISSELLWELSTRTHIVLQKQFNKESQSGTDVGTVENPGPDLDMSVENRAKNLIQFANFDTRSGDASDKDNLVCADKVKQIVSSLCVFQGKLEEMVKHEVAELQAQ